VCLVLFGRDRDGRRVIAANRDEFYDRPTAPAAWWNDAPILAGRDLEAGGTWLGVSRGGRVALVTNVREGVASSGESSRGELVRRYLESRADPESWLATIDRDRYGGFNLVVGDGGRLWYASNRTSAPPCPIDDALHALSNAGLDTPWPKVLRARAAFAAALGRREGDLEALFALLADCDRPPDDALPDTGVGLEIERLLSTAFIRSSLYGTRASTLVSLGSDEIVFVERRFGPDGRSGESRFRFSPIQEP
jgi:uncharacterized protein with NRDE domain